VSLGSNSSGGDDDGFRTYSVDYLHELTRRLGALGQVVVFGTSGDKTTTEQARYRSLIAQQPGVVDLVDRTDLEGLLQLLQALDLVVAIDSGPLHMAMALGTPAVGLFVHSAAFRLSPALDPRRVVALEAHPVCSRFSARAKFFCRSCQDRHSRMYGCQLKTIARKLDCIPLDRVVAEAVRLLDRDRSDAPRHEANDSGREGHEPSLDRTQSRPGSVEPFSSLQPSTARRG
jgi:ADP-heptose:LPS heptosyltransferase